MLMNGRLMTFDAEYAREYQLGFGNQMFIYASVLGIALSLNYTPVFREPRNKSPLSHIFELSSFAELKVQGEEFSQRYYPSYFDSDALNMSTYNNGNHELQGCFQSWKYFANVTRKLRNEDFKCKKKITETSIKQLISLVGVNCSAGGQVLPDCLLVAVHARRGDHVTGKFASYGFLESPNAYFLRAVEWFLDATQFAKFHLVFIVTSNDALFSKSLVEDIDANISSSRVSAVVLKPNLQQPGYDLCLLSMCNHTIMSLGTYGWMIGFLAGGHVIYDKNSIRPDSPAWRWYNGKLFEEFFMPGWVGL